MLDRAKELGSHPMVYGFRAGSGGPHLSVYPAEGCYGVEPCSVVAGRYGFDGYVL
jgi:hypothetical protein